MAITTRPSPFLPEAREGRPRRRAASVAAMVVSLAAMLFSLAPAGSAQAAAGAAFDPNVPAVFASKSANASDPTALYRLAPQPNGTFAYVSVGTDSNLVYNALTYNPIDHYLYAISGDPLNSRVPEGSLLKIGANGTYDVIGTQTFRQTGFQTNMGAFDTEQKVFYVLSAQGSQMFRIDLDPASPTYGTLLSTVTVTPADHDAQGGGSDMTFANGAFWTLGRSGIFRINRDGSTNSFGVPAGAASALGGTDQAGAAWTYLGGDLGFSYNGSGEVIRIKVTNPTSATPTFTTVLKSGGSPSGQNDGAAIPGTVDLAIAKAGRFEAGGDKVVYTLDVTNNGGAASTGWTVTDDIPAGFTGISVSGAGTATVAGNKVTVVGGALAVGAKATIVVTVTAPASRPSTFTNTASVLGADPDPQPSNNQASAALTYPTVDEPGDVADEDDELAAPDTGAEQASTWQPWAAVAGGLALMLAVLGRTVAVRRRP